MSELNKYIFKLNFKTPVHFGSGRLGSSENFIFADTLFSALYKEAIKIYGDEETDSLRILADESNFLISDLFPFINNTLFIPKPFAPIESDKQGDSIIKKKFKKMKFLPIEDLTDYLNGNYIPDKSVELLNTLGKKSVNAKVKINENEDNKPYNVGIFTFDNSDKETGLYFIAFVNAQKENMIFNLMDSLSYTGLGGKLSSGLGKFDYTYEKIPQIFAERFDGIYKRYMTLSISLPTDDELSNSMRNANYEIVKRSGFVSSETYSSNPQRKNNLYCFKSGSVFENRFDGGIYDVSGQGNHAVYRYAKPMFLGMD